jgi:hypothetical protein
MGEDALIAFSILPKRGLCIPRILQKGRQSTRPATLLSASRLFRRRPPLDRRGRTCYDRADGGVIRLCKDLEESAV